MTAMSLVRRLYLLIVCLFIVLFLSSSSLPPGDKLEKIRSFTRDIEFNFLAWTIQASKTKFDAMVLSIPGFLPEQTQKQVVLDYLDLIRQIETQKNKVMGFYSDPNITDPGIASAKDQMLLAGLTQQRDISRPVAESILQHQISIILASFGLVFAGQPVPPVMFHSTPLPLALIVSPRESIRQDQSISLESNLSMSQIVELENKVDTTLNVSSLVEQIGGISTYPTMVSETTDINWLADVVSHEWIHNFFSFQPLGFYYDQSSQIRTMNETAASIAGTEISQALVGRFYPQLLPPPPQNDQEPVIPPEKINPPVFNFREEMHKTRVTVDELLAAGKIEQAENYMELRRIFFWENGYHFRKLNQAYFAFHGAYADQPGGAAGEDPVGKAVREYRKKSPSLSTFIRNIALMRSFSQLQDALKPGN